MPRRPNFKPFKRAGGYHVYSPLDGGVVDLHANDPRVATSKAQALRRHYEETAAREGKMPKTRAESPKSRTAAPKQPTAQSMVTSWMSSSPPSPPSPPDVSSPDASPSPSPQSEPLSSSFPTSPEPSSQALASQSPESRVAALMPDDRRKRLADLCARGAAQISVLLVGATVRVFGRIPSPDVDAEEKLVLQEGLSLWMEEVFVDHPPRPWMVVGGAAVGIGIGMYVDGTPVKRAPTIRPPANPEEVG